MCVYCKDLNNMEIKEKFPIPVIDELLYELHRAIFLPIWISSLDIIKLE